MAQHIFMYIYLHLCVVRVCAYSQDIFLLAMARCLDDGWVGCRAGRESETARQFDDMRLATCQSQQASDAQVLSLFLSRTYICIHSGYIYCIYIYILTRKNVANAHIDLLSLFYISSSSFFSLSRRLDFFFSFREICNQESFVCHRVANDRAPVESFLLLVVSSLNCFLYMQHKEDGIWPRRRGRNQPTHRLRQRRRPRALDKRKPGMALTFRKMSFNSLFSCFIFSAPVFLLVFFTSSILALAAHRRSISNTNIQSSGCSRTVSMEMLKE